jgi:enamine deaminase RidA (YjgF/YER057c/UK114 family)
MTIERRNVGKRLSDLVIYAPPPGGRLVYLAGQVAEDPHQGITGQVESVLAQIDRLLDEAGTDKKHILSATIYLPNMSDFAAMNAVWEKWVPQGDTPARATVEAKLANPKYKVEIQVVAAAG